MSAAPSVAVVVPVYNEGSTIAAALREIVASAARLAGRWCVIAVDDGSTDGSRATLLALASELEGLEVELHDANRGYGVALRSGAARARRAGFDYVVFIDSDLTNPPADLLVIARLAAAGEPYIKASRFVAGGGMAAVPARRRLVSVIGNRIGAALLGAGIRDVTNGFRAVRLDLLERWPLTEPGFASIVEELAFALRDGVRPVEFPSVLGTRDVHQRPSAFPYSARLIGKYLMYGLSVRRQRVMDRRRRS